jgi:hypothetical protein|tara:strand:- start:26 stop:199 length:174 start_codon:yes stop_codon:yes gene_type:complete
MVEGGRLPAAARAEEASSGKSGKSDDGTDHSGCFLKNVVSERERLFANVGTYFSRST